MGLAHYLAIATFQSIKPTPQPEFLSLKKRDALEIKSMTGALESFQLKRWISFILIGRKVIPGQIDVHPTDNALIVHYTVQAPILGDDGKLISGDKKSMEKMYAWLILIAQSIRIKSLSSKSNIGALAKEVVEKCKLINHNKLKDVEQQLFYLQKRGNALTDNARSIQPETSITIDSLESLSSDVPHFSRIEEYIEGLYEEMPDKINSTRNILQLARIPENMEALIENDALISALARVLREDGKKSMVCFSFN